MRRKCPEPAEDDGEWADRLGFGKLVNHFVRSRVRNLTEKHEGHMEMFGTHPSEPRTVLRARLQSLLCGGNRCARCLVQIERNEQAHVYY